MQNQSGPEIVFTTRFIISCYTVITLALFIYSAHAENKPTQDKLPLDTVVIMDSSGSMKKTDPKQLRKPAAKLFISLLDNQDRLSVVSFSSKAWPITFLTQLKNETQRKQALRATDKISHKGMYTNIHSALAKGLEFLKKSNQLNRDPIIILMSDGQMDVGNNKQSAKLKKQIFDNLLPQLIKHKIKVYSIAFTAASDQALLQEIADATDGRYALAASDDVLHKVFSKIFEQTKQPDMLPLNENKFIIDSSINEITIIANKSSENSKIYLQPPSGKKINATFKSKNIKWFISTSFDMITIKKPEEGEWNILFSDDDNRAYIITDIKLRTQFEFIENTETPELIIKSWFLQKEEPEENKSLLKNMDVVLEIETPSGVIKTLPTNEANEEGIFISQYAPKEEGIYGATIIAKSRTFQRQQTFSFRNTLPINPKIAPKTIRKEPVLIEEIIEETAPEIKEPEEQEDAIKILIYFGIFNVIIVFLGLNGFLIYRRLKANKQKTTQ